MGAFAFVLLIAGIARMFSSEPPSSLGVEYLEAWSARRSGEAGSMIAAACVIAVAIGYFASRAP